MHRVVALVLPRVVAFDLASAAHVFGTDDAGRYGFALCAAAPGPVASTSGFPLVAEHGLEALAAADTVIVPGFEPREDPPAPVLAALRAAHARGARVVSICTGAFALAAAGLLDGRRATTHWRHADELRVRFSAVAVAPEVLYVDEGDVATSAGVAAGIDLCLHLVRHDHGADVAGDIARRMVVAPHRAGGQAQFVARPLPPEPGGGLAATRAWMLEHLAEPLTVAECARHAGWSARSFARHFRAETGTTPLRWLHAQRVAEAQKLLERSALPVEEVARLAGFGTATSLRAHLRRAAQSTPSAYRAAFRG
jgi:AraC family transcriptional activator FtrA